MEEKVCSCTAGPDGDQYEMQIEKDFADSKYASRKFLICAVILLIGTVSLFLGKLNSSDWVDLSRWIALTYLGANVAQKKVLR